MNKPSERIVVFVSPAQKRAISTTAENLGISVSELMRRAVLSFGATSEQVKAASIVDRLRAPREPDALNEALQRVARASKHLRQATPAALRSPVPGSNSTPTENDTVFAASGTPQAALAPIDVATPVAALAAHDVSVTPDSTDDEATAQAAARVAAAKAAALASHDAPDTATSTHAPSGSPARPSSKRNAASERQQEHEDDEPGIDPAEGSGHFA
ncbi:hypothetical protein K788_0003863 [Paraburkholderia caribensis MBA4]|uniref:Uncharacterized protein n=1 Tax=Paraburkholderia caribensis MBA4 TaxID=1323664 RepID=A0A0N7JU51_9BURK|nr:hypothetical protein [Paraburkholderia caribensis]ALL65437.1 hypothetical protein K788_0003863 [Paraburkholderia caribensis MBA4]